MADIMQLVPKEVTMLCMWIAAAAKELVSNG
jgi:hypothetical protein